MTHPWRIIAAALLCCYFGSWLLLYQRGWRWTVGQQDAALLLTLAVGVVALCLAVWGWTR